MGFASISDSVVLQISVIITRREIVLFTKLYFRTNNNK